MSKRNEFKIVDFKGELTAEKLNEILSKALPDYHNNCGVYVKGEDYVSIDIDDEFIKREMIDASDSFEHCEDKEIYKDNHISYGRNNEELNYKQRNIIADWVLNSNQSEIKYKLRNEILSYINSEFYGYIAYKNGDNVNYSCWSWNKIQKENANRGRKVIKPEWFDENFKDNLPEEE